MAMIECPECGREISDTAESCPSCGYSLKKQKEKKTTKAIWKVTGLIFLACIVIMLLLPSGNKNAKSGSGTHNAGTVQTVRKPISEVTDSIVATMRKTFGQNVSIKVDGSNVIANVWLDGVAEDALLAKNGDKEMLAAWDEVTKSLKGLAGDMQGYLDAAGHGDKTAVINLQNDLDKSKTLLTVTKNRVILDAVK